MRSLKQGGLIEDVLYYVMYKKNTSIYSGAAAFSMVNSYQSSSHTLSSRGILLTFLRKSWLE